MLRALVSDHEFGRLSFIPPVLAMLTSLVALVAAAYFGSPYLCIPSAVGIFASGYSLYHAYRARHLKNFETNNTRYLALNQELQSEIEGIKKTAVSLGSDITSLHNELSTLQTENQELNNLNSSLKTNIEQLELNKKELENIQLGFLELINNFNQQKQQFDLVCKTLETGYNEQQQIITACQELAKSMDATSKLLANTYAGLLSSCSIKLQQEVQELENQRSQLTQACSLLQEQVEGLKNIHNQLSQATSDYTEQNKILKEIVNHISLPEVPKTS